MNWYVIETHPGDRFRAADIRYGRTAVELEGTVERYDRLGAEWKPFKTGGLQPTLMTFPYQAIHFTAAVSR